MDVITFNIARATLAEIIDRVCANREPITITRKGGQAVVIMALEDYTALKETNFLLRSSKNARRLLESIAILE